METNTKKGTEQRNSEPRIKEQKQTSYYIRLILLAIPITMQHIVSIGLNLVDNIMVGRLGPLELAAVGAANQVYTIYSMILFGLFSGAGVLVAQYYGAGNIKKIRTIMGMDVAIGLVLALFTFGLAQILAPQIIYIFVDDPKVIGLGVEYLRITSFTYLTTAVSFAVSYNSRPIQRMTVPAIIQVVSILTNTVLNYFLIYGTFGFPQMGVRGAAYATLIARIFELAAYIAYIVIDKEHPFHAKLSEYIGIDTQLAVSAMKTAMPVLISEGGWALGVSLVYAAYGKISPEALAVAQIGKVICDFSQCASFGLGSAGAALIGETIGKGDTTNVFAEAKKYLRVQWAQTLIMVAIILGIRKPIAIIYDFDAATTEMLMLSLFIFSFTQIPRIMSAALQCGILRPGGDTFYCMVVELATNLVIEVALAYISVLVFGLPLHLCILVASCGNLIKCTIMYYRFYSKKWINVVIEE